MVFAYRRASAVRRHRLTHSLTCVSSADYGIILINVVDVLLSSQGISQIPIIIAAEAS